MEVKLELIKEEREFLVAGYSLLVNDWVFGFPYFAKTNKRDGKVDSCPCIILPTLMGENPHLNEGGYDIAFKKMEFHPIKGSLHRFVEARDGIYLFEDNIYFNI